MSRKERVDKAGDQPKRFNNVFVKNFADLLDENEFSEIFSKFGDITSAVIMRDIDGKSRGFGFVAFKEHEAAEQVFISLLLFSCSFRIMIIESAKGVWY